MYASTVCELRAPPKADPGHPVNKKTAAATVLQQAAISDVCHRSPIITDASLSDIFLAWGKVEITTWAHKINGLTESDFILAAKIDQLYKS
jgi:hypothetical protein